MILEVELWDYWASTDMMLAKGIIDIRHIIKEKKDLVPISLRKSS